MILIDYSPIVMSSAYTSWTIYKKGQSQLPFAVICEAGILTRLKNAVAVGRKNLGADAEVVVAVDSRPYWRKEVFQHYKQNRTPLAEQSSDIPWKEVFDAAATVQNAINGVFGWKLVCVPTAEADDIIGTLVLEFPEKNIMIVSRDGDFKQLHRPGVTQWDNVGNKFIKEPNPTRFLHEKIIRGDKKDGIPNIKSSADCLINNELRQVPLRKATVNEWLRKSYEDFCDADMYRRYRENRTLIDFNYIPADLKQKIIDEYNQLSVTGNVYTWLASRGHANLISFVKDFA